MFFKVVAREPSPKQVRNEVAIRLFVGSWNLAGEIPDAGLDLSKWIGSTGKELP
jgi:hypothetical protein